MSNKECLSPLERAIRQKIRGTKPKSKQPGFLKEVILREYEIIEEALESGCEFDDISSSISETTVKVSAATLKKYHLANRKALKKRQGSTEVENSGVGITDNSETEQEAKNTSPSPSKEEDRKNVVSNNVQIQSEVGTHDNISQGIAERKMSLAERVSGTPKSVDIFDDDELESEFNNY